MTPYEAWWEGYEDGYHNEILQEIPFYQDDYYDGYDAGQEDAGR